MAVIGSLIVRLIGDTSEFDKAMKTAGQKMQDVGSGLMNAGKGLTAGVTLPLAALGAVAVNAASDLGESMNKVQVVFGETADEVIAFTSTAATQLGMSQQAALEATGTFGNLFSSMGMGIDTSAEMSTNLVQLATDLASFNNIDPAEALEKLRAGLVGETEPLRTLGVNLSAAAVEAKALEMGLAGTKDELTPAMLAQARYALILEQTTNAQGDFARTADGFANTMRTTKAQFLDAAAALGQKLLPYAQKLLEWVQQGITWFQQLSPQMQNVAIIVAVVAAAIGPLLMVLGGVISAVGTIVGVLSGPLLLVIGLVIAVVALLAAAWANNWGGIREKTQAVVEWIKGFISGALAAIQGFWSEHGEQIKQTITKFWDAIKLAFQNAVDFVKRIIDLFQSGTAEDWRQFGEDLRESWVEMWDKIKEIISELWDWFKTWVPQLGRDVIAWFKAVDWLAIGKGLLQGIWAGIVNTYDWLKKKITQWVGSFLAFIKGLLGIKSPSEEMMKVGEMMVRGLEMGWGAPVLGSPRVAGFTGLSTDYGNGLNGLGGEKRVTIFGGANFYGVQDGRSVLEELQGIA